MNVDHVLRAVDEKMVLNALSSTRRKMQARFSGKCEDCRKRINAGEPITFDTVTRKVFCETCTALAEGSPAPTVIRVSQAGGDVDFRIDGRLDAEAFANYRKSLADAQYSQGVNRLPIGRGASAVASLHAAGFTLDVDPAVQRAIQAAEEEQARVAVEAAQRTAKVDAVLAARGGSLYDYQREGVTWLAPRKAALIADDMGLGKTIQALTALPANAATIVVCPAVAKPVWRSEAAKWRPELRVTVLDGRGSFRAPVRGEIVVINPDILSGKVTEGADGRLAVEAGSTPSLLPETNVIVDEAHVFANSKSQRTLRMRALTQAARDSGGHVWILTATPLKNTPPELWNVLQLAGLGREAFGSWPNFVRVFNGRPGQWGGMEWGYPSAEVPDLLKRVSLRRSKTEVLKDLPDKTHQTTAVSIDRATGKALDEALRDLGGDVNVEEAIERLATTGLGFTKLSEARALLSKAKIPAMMEVVEAYEAQGEPLVVFSAYRAPIDLLGQRLGWATITGDTSNERRGEIVDQFQAGRLRGVACTIRAGGVAITLTRASNVLRVDREWNPALNVQAEDRVYRIGQKNAVLVTDLVADHPLDRKIADVLERKESLIQGSVEATNVTHVEPEAPVDVDWNAIAGQAAAAVREVERARAAAEAVRNEHAKQIAEVRVRNAVLEARKKVRSAAARRLREPETAVDAPRRGSRDTVERWAIRGLQQLASDDPDRAREKNEVGFNASDGGIGHALAWLGELTDQEWRLAVQIARHYPGQIGSP